MALSLPSPSSWDDLRFVLDLIAKAMVDTGGRQLTVRGGTANLAFPGAVAVLQAAYNHNLGRAPLVVIVPGVFKNGVVDGYLTIDPALSTTTQFTVFARMNAAPAAGNYPFYWFAVG